MKTPVMVLVLAAFLFIITVSITGNGGPLGKIAVIATTQATTISLVSPLNNTYSPTPGMVSFQCNIQLAGPPDADITDAFMTIRKYYGGWYVNKIIDIEQVDVSGQSDTEVSVADALNLTSGFYTYQCTATDNLGNMQKSSEYRYMTGKGTVYVFQAVDTEAEPLIYADDRHPIHYVTNLMPNGNMKDVMNVTWRNQYTDSFGNPTKFVWFLKTGETFCEAYTAWCDLVISLVKIYWKPNITYFGDGISWHYHHEEWYNWTQFNQLGYCPQGGCQPSGYWNQLTTMEGTIYREKSDTDIAEKHLAVYILHSGLYPVTYRSGWGWENTDFNNWIENLVPIDHSIPGEGWPDTVEPVFNVHDWKGVPKAPYNPSPANLKLPGTMKKVIMPCFGGTPSTYISEVFELAGNGTNAILCHYLHNYGAINNMKQHAESVNSQLRTKEQQHPGVKFIYADDVKAAQGLFETEDTTPPTIGMWVQGNWIYVNSSEELFNPPVIAIKKKTQFGQRPDYMLARPESAGALLWRFDRSGMEIESIRAGGIDMSYNPSTSNLYTFPVLRIDSPTSPAVNVSYPQNLTVEFTITETAGGISAAYIKVGGSNCILQGGLAQLDSDTYRQKCQVPNLPSSTKYDVELSVDHQQTGNYMATQKNAVYYVPYQVVLSPIWDIVANERTRITITASAQSLYGYNISYFINSSLFVRSNTSSNIFTWRTNEGSSGQYDIQVNATDGTFWDIKRFRVTIRNTCIFNKRLWKWDCQYAENNRENLV